MYRNAVVTVVPLAMGGKRVQNSLLFAQRTVRTLMPLSGHSRAAFTAVGTTACETSAAARGGGTPRGRGCRRRDRDTCTGRIVEKSAAQTDVGRRGCVCGRGLRMERARGRAPERVPGLCSTTRGRGGGGGGGENRSRATHPPTHPRIPQKMVRSGNRTSLSKTLDWFVPSEVVLQSQKTTKEPPLGSMVSANRRGLTVNRRRFTSEQGLAFRDPPGASRLWQSAKH